MSMSLKDDQIKLYEMLRSEQLHCQERIHNLLIYGIVATAILWGYAIDKMQLRFSYLIALIPAVYAPFLFSWARELSYSGHRIAKYVREVLEPKITNGTKNQGWEHWVENYREMYEKRKWFSFSNAKDTNIILGFRLYDTMFPIIIVFSIALSIFLARSREGSCKSSIAIFLGTTEGIEIIFMGVICLMIYGYFKHCAEYNKKQLLKSKKSPKK